MKKSKNIILLIIVSTILFSCTQDIQGPYNQLGDKGRRNSYEKFGTFYTRYVFTDEIKSSDSSGSIQPPLSLSNTEFVLANTNSSILLISKREVKWTFKLDSDESVASGMAADNEKNVYAVSTSGMLYAISYDGKLLWKKNFVETIDRFTTFSDLLVLKDGIIASASDGTYCKFSFEGKILWKNKSNLSVTKAITADDNDNLAVPLTEGIFGGTDSLNFVTSGGKIKWSIGFPGFRLIKNPVVNHNKIYVSGVYESGEIRNSIVYAIDNTGKILWKKELSIVPYFLSAGDEGNLYVLGYNSGLGDAMSGIFAFSPDGALLWKLYLEARAMSPLLISEKSIALTGMTSKAPGVFFLSKEGELTKTISLADSPILILQPVVTSEPVITFACANKLSLVRIDETPIGKILLW